ncbi:MAG: hypothetical protein M5U19_14520 [Microthrixaceae bacterium]|nr:hypothetical protein [Microthrixaceae bacterium]
MLIGFLDSQDPHHRQARVALAGAIDSEARLALPESAFEEVLGALLAVAAWMCCWWSR